MPINALVPVEGTSSRIPEPLEFVRTVAAARIAMPKAWVRLSAGARHAEPVRRCALAGANSVFYGEKLLTTGNPQVERDHALFEKLGIRTA